MGNRVGAAAVFRGVSWKAPSPRRPRLHCLHPPLKPSSLARDLWRRLANEGVDGGRGTMGYIDPEYAHTGRVRSASDVYGLGVLMLEVLTGKKVFSQAEELNRDLVPFALPIIEAGNIEEMLDRRPVPEPTPWQLRTLKRVAQIARCCVKFAGNDRPTISGIVANVERVHELICRDGPGSVDKSGLWPFFEKVDLQPYSDSPHTRSVSSAGYYSDLEPEVLEDGR